MTVSNNGAVPLVQLDPKNVSIAAIASGHYDGYLSATPRPSARIAARSS